MLRATFSFWLRNSRMEPSRNPFHFNNAAVEHFALSGSPPLVIVESSRETRQKKRSLCTINFAFWETAFKEGTRKRNQELYPEHDVYVERVCVCACACVRACACMRVCMCCEVCLSIVINCWPWWKWIVILSRYGTLQGWSILLLDLH